MTRATGLNPWTSSKAREQRTGEKGMQLPAPAIAAATRPCPSNWPHRLTNTESYKWRKTIKGQLRRRLEAKNMGIFFRVSFPEWLKIGRVSGFERMKGGIPTCQWVWNQLLLRQEWRIPLLNLWFSPWRCGFQMGLVGRELQNGDSTPFRSWSNETSGQRLLLSIFVSACLDFGIDADSAKWKFCRERM